MPVGWQLHGIAHNDLFLIDENLFKRVIEQWELTVRGVI